MLRLKSYVEALMPRKSDLLYTNSMFLLASSVVGAGGGFLFWVICARLFDPSDIGLANGMIASASLVALLSRFGLDVSVVRFSGKPRSSFRNTLGSSLILISFGATLFSIGFVLGSGIWANALHPYLTNGINFVLFWLFSIGFALEYYVESAYIGLRHAKFVFVVGVLIVFAKIVLILLSYRSFGSLGPYVAWGFSILIGLSCSLLVLLPSLKSSPTFSRGSFGRLEEGYARFSAASYFVQLATVLPNQVLPLIILGLLGTSANAFFFVAWTIAGVVWVIPVSFSRSMLAEASNNESLVHEHGRKSARYSLTITAIAVIVGIVFGKPLLAIMGSDYSDHSYIVLIFLLLSSVAIVFNSTYNVLLQIRRRLGEFIIIGVLTSASFLAITVATIEHRGIEAIGVSWLVIQSLLSIYCVKRFYFEPANDRRRRSSR